MFYAISIKDLTFSAYFVILIKTFEWYIVTNKHCREKKAKEIAICGTHYHCHFFFYNSIFLFLQIELVYYNKF